MMMTAFLLCIYVGSSSRKAAKSLEAFNFMSSRAGLLLRAAPCPPVIPYKKKNIFDKEGWLVKEAA
jgi:hypothetical protein